MVRYREIKPGEPLRPFVDSFWLLEQDGEAAAPQRIVPDGHCELILNWHQPFEYFNGTKWVRQSACFFAGQIERPLLLRPAGRTRVLGVRFRPNGATALLRMPMTELSGRFTPADNLSPALGRRLSRVLEAPNPIAAMEAALLPAAGGAASHDPLVRQVLEKISHAPGPFRIHDLTRDFGVSTRHLERRFAAAVGLSPKAFSRILRFNRVFGRLEDPRRNWAETAAGCGYYDQAHLIRDCHALAGTTPRVLLAEDGDLARHFYRRFGVSHSYNHASRRIR